MRGLVAQLRGYREFTTEASHASPRGRSKAVDTKLRKEAYAEQGAGLLRQTTYKGRTVTSMDIPSASKRL